MAATALETPITVEEANKSTATRFIEGFNDNNWDLVREIVAPDFVFHHPLGGTVQAGPEGMVATWAGFKALSPDSWHPIPVMVAEGDHVAVLLPTYGTFTGHSDHAPPPTRGRLDYGMVNMVRIENGQLAETWFGMDSLVEMQQMGVAPAPPTRLLTPAESANIDAFAQSVSPTRAGYDTVTAFGDVVVALSPPQRQKSTSVRRVEIYRMIDGEALPILRRAFTTDPPYGGDPRVDTEASRALVERWIDQILVAHEREALAEIVSLEVLVHPTAMPCEATHFGIAGVRHWLAEQWEAFPDLSVTDHFSVAHGNIVAVRWTASGTSAGPFLGLDPSGTPITYTGVSMFLIEDGRIAEIWETRNTLGIMGQINPDLAGSPHHH